MKPGVRLLILCVQILSFDGMLSADSEIKVTDSWPAAGTITLEGLDWSAKLQKGSEGLTVLSGENQVSIAPGARIKNQPITLTSCQIEDSGEKGSVTLLVRFRFEGNTIESRFVFESDGSLKVLPGVGLSSLGISADISYGVLSGLSLDDVIYAPDDYDDYQVIHIPSENLFWALLGDETGILTIAWPQGEQLIRLAKEGNKFSRLEIELDEKPFYLQLQSASGIWHKEPLKLQYLEKDVEIQWERPFDAEWKTQLLVSNVPTTWVFNRRSARMWLPMLGFFRYPVWFDGPATMLHLSKKIPPKGFCFIYPLDGHPNTPLGFVEQTPVGEIVEDRTKRLRIDKEHSNLTPNVGYVHCWGTSIMQRTIYKYGLQARERELLNEHIDYCVDYVNRIQQQSLGYYAFICEMKEQLALWVKEAPQGSAPSTFLEKMQMELAKVEEMYHSRVERGGRKTPQEHMAYASDLGRKLKELIRDSGRESYPEAKFILDTFNALAAATDEDVPAGFGITIRHMFQEAGSSCVDKQEVVRYAEEIRKRIWQKTKTRNYETTGL